MHGIVSPSVVYTCLRFYWRIHTQRTSVLWYTQNCVVYYRQKQICILTKFMCAFYLWEKSILRLRRWLMQQTAFYANMRICIQSSIPTWKDWLWRHMHAISELEKLRKEDSWGLLTRRSSLIFKSHHQCLPQNIREEWLRKTPDVNLWSPHTWTHV